MDKHPRPPTIRDVARLASVSFKTVSRVLNDRPEVSEQTRRRVLDAMRELGFRPNALARGLVTRRTGTIGLIIADITNPFYPEVVRGVEDAAHARGESVLLCNSDEDPAKELAYLEELQERRVDGVILCASRAEADLLTRAAESGMPLVLINREIAHPRIGCVSVDHEAGVEAAVRHLVSSGRRRIAYLAGPHRSHAAVLRQRHFRAMVAELLPGEPQRVVEDVAPRREAGREAAHRVLDRWPDTDALFAYNDLMALGAMDALRERGRAVPQEVAVMGFDDIPESAAASPPLSTVAQPKYELGRRAASLLRQLRELPAGMGPLTMRLAPALKLRASTGAPPAPPGAG